MSQISLSSVPDTILWHEGMLLRPEHFEQLTLRMELLQQYHASVAPFSWGVSRLVVDESALRQGRFSALELEARLPDGLALRVGADFPQRPAIDLNQLDATFQQQPFYIYLAALAVQPGAANPMDLRFAAVSEADEALLTGSATLPEEGEEEEHLPIPRLRPRFQLIASHEDISSQYVAMPIARLSYRNGSWALDTEYVAPVERAAADSPLLKMCSATLRKVRDLAIFTQNRWRSMSAKERGQNQHLVGNIRSLVAALPLCEALVSAGECHPFSLYLGFCTLAGQVAGIAAEPIPPVFAPYDHNDLVRSFAELDGYIQHILGEGDSREFIGIPMIYADGVFSIPFAMEWSGKRLVIALRALGSNESGAAAWCESALIGSHKLQPGMRERRVLGAERQRVLAEKGLYAAPNIVLFHLHEDHDYIHVGEPLDIVGGPASPAGNLPVEIVLYIRQTSN